MKKLFYLIAIVGFVMVSCTKPENPNPNEEKTYSFSIGAEKETGDTDETRVEMVDGLMHWSVGDQVGLFVHNHLDTRVGNLPMTGTHTAPARSTTFVGQLTQSDMEKMSLIYNNRYVNHNYASYYPYDSNIIGHQYLPSSDEALNLRQRLPATITVRKNEFPSDHVFMVAFLKDIPPITWLDENGKQQWNERITFTYKHVYSYLRVKIGTMPAGVESFNFFQLAGFTGNFSQWEIESKHYFQLTGTFYSSTEYGFGPVNTTRTTAYYFQKNVNIDGEGISSGDYIYIPMPCNGYLIGTVDLRSGTNFSFNFGSSGNDLPYKKVVRAGTLPIKRLEPGKIYDITINL